MIIHAVGFRPRSRSYRFTTLSLLWYAGMSDCYCCPATTHLVTLDPLALADAPRIGQKNPPQQFYINRQLRLLFNSSYRKNFTHLSGQAYSTALHPFTLHYPHLTTHFTTPAPFSTHTRLDAFRLI